MDTSTILAASFAGLIVWAIILSVIISNSSRSKEILQQLRRQTYILAKMAEKQGVPSNEINDILKLGHWYKVK